MKKTFLLLNRMALMVGLLVALTPCGLCHGASLKTLQKGHGCCAQEGTQAPDAHSSRGPLCQIMDQSSLSVETVHLDLPAVVPGPLVSLPLLHGVETVVTSFVPAAPSPPRSTQVLRI